MGNGRKQTALWLVFVEGAALSLGIYLLLTVLLSALVVKAVLPEEGSFPAVAASCCLASFAGAMLSVRRSSWGSLASAMVSAAGFLLAVVAVALLCWQQITWLGRGGVLLLCGAGGGLLAGLLGPVRRLLSGAAGGCVCGAVFVPGAAAADAGAHPGVERKREGGEHPWQETTLRTLGLIWRRSVTPPRTPSAPICGT